MKDKRFKSLKPGECFIHHDDIYIKSDLGLHPIKLVVNLQTGATLHWCAPNARVSPIKLELQMILPNKNKDAIPIPGYFENNVAKKHK